VSGGSRAHAEGVPDFDVEGEFRVYPPERIDASGDVLVDVEPVSPPASLLDRFAALPPRQRHRWIAAAIVTTLIVVASLVSNRSRPEPSVNNTDARPSKSVVAGPPLPGEAVDIGLGEPIDVTFGRGVGYALTVRPSRLVVFDVATHRTMNAALVGEGTVFVLFDEQAPDLLWTVAVRGAASDLVAYDPLFLTVRARAKLDAAVMAATSIQGTLWMTTPSGLYRLPVGAKAASRVADVDGQLRAIAADPTRGRVLVSAGDMPAAIVSVDAVTTKVLARTSVQLGKLSIAANGTGVWIGGYGNGDTPRVMRLDPRTLKPSGGSPVANQVGPGATVWNGHQSVWVLSGGNESLVCVNAASGRVLARWSGVSGPVVSTGTSALTISRGVVVELVTMATPCYQG